MGSIFNTVATPAPGVVVGPWGYRTYRVVPVCGAPGDPSSFHQMPAKKVDKKVIQAMKTINALNLDALESTPGESSSDTSKETRHAKFAKYLAERRRRQEASQQNEASRSSDAQQ